MPVTGLRGRQVLDGDITRSDINTSTAGSALIARIIAGTNISITSTGADSGTGDVTISATGTGLNGTGFVRMAGSTPSYITGTSSQFIKADGSLDSNTYLTTVSDVWVNNSGDSMTGNLSFGSSGAGITWAANTDGASITFESTGDGASGGRALSNLLIALTDNGDEGLKVTTTGSELLYVNINQFQYKGNNVWHAGNLTNLNQLTNGPGYLTSESDTLATVTNRGNTTTGRINVRGIGNQSGGNILMGNTGNATNKWSYLTGAHYNADSQPQGFALIGGLSTDTTNAVVIGGNIYETNPATQIQFWTHSATTHNLGGTQRGVIDSAGNWGIGALSPGQTLHVYNGNGNLGYKTARFDSNDTANGTRVLITNSGNTSNRGFALVTGGSGGVGPGADNFSIGYYNADSTFVTQNIFNITSSGNVGIGTTTPNQKLSVEGGSIYLNANNVAANYYLYLNKKSGQDGGILFNRDNANDWQLTNGSGNGDLIFYSYGTGTEAITFKKTTGNVGIGTTSPATALHVIGDLTQQTSLNTTAQFFLLLRKSRGTVTAPTTVLVNDEAGGIMFQGYDGSTWRSGAGIRAQVQSVSAGSLSSNLEFFAGNGSISGATRVMVMRGDTQNVGIGTTNPTHRLQIQGSSDSGIRLTDSSGNTRALLNPSGVQHGEFSLYNNSGTTTTYLGGGGGNNFVMNGGGNFGINTSFSGIVAPALLTIKASATDGNQIYIIQSNDDRGWRFRARTDGHFYLQSSYLGSDTDRFMIQYDTGNVGIGTTSPSYKLDVSGGSARVQNNPTTNDWGFVVQNTNTGGWGVSSFLNLYGYASSPAAYFDVLQIRASYPAYGTVDFLVREQAQSSQIAALSIKGDGNVGIRVTSPANKLQVGSVGSSGYGGNDLAIGNGTGVMAFYQTNTLSTWYTNTNFSLMPAGAGGVGNLAVGTSTASNRLTVSGSADITNALFVGYTTAEYGEKLRVNGGVTTYHTYTQSGTLSRVGNVSQLITTTAGGAGYYSGLTYTAFTGSHDNTFNGSVTIPNSVGAGGINSTTSIRFGAANVSVTMTQSGSFRSYDGVSSGIAPSATATGGSISHVSAFHALAPYYVGSNTPTITNYFGLLLNDSAEYSTWVAITNRWGIYQHGSGDNNYFAGKVMVGTTTVPTQLMYVNGTSYFNGNMTVNGTITELSTINIKTNVETLDGALGKVEKMRGVSYNRKDNHKKEIGFIAEEVEEVYPEFVEHDEQGNPVGLHYARLTAVLLQSVKELSSRIKELEKRN